MKYKTLIIDDENLAIEVIETHLSKFTEFEIVGKCNNALQAIEVLRKQCVDLIFLDIQMPEITGLEFLKSVNVNAEVIITTAFREFAVEGFEFNVLDYLLKPISLDRFVQAIDKFYQKHQIIQSDSQPKPKAQSKEIFIRADRTYQKISINEIIYIESIKDYVKIYTTTGMKITKQSISKFEEDLPSDIFLRIHRSYLVNLDKISGFTNSSVLIGKKELTIGKTYQERVLKFLNDRMRLI